MQRQSTLLLAALLLGACGAPKEEAAMREVGQAAAVPPQPAPSGGGRVDLQNLQAERAALQSQYEAQRIERDRWAAQVAAHQADGEQRLTALKAQWKRVDAGARERLAEAARNEMESALMLDEEYRAQLLEADERLQRTEHELHDLREREAALRK